MNNVYLIVGGGYHAFARNTRALTLDELESKLPDLSEDDVILAGQGLTHAERAKLRQVLSERRSSPKLLYCDEACAPACTHKHTVDNVVIGTLERTAQRTYSCILLADTRADRLFDHITGQHLNGMLLIEAARQAGIAAIESEFVAAPGEKKWSLAWSRCDTRFFTYAFPVPTTLTVSFPKTDGVDTGQVPLEFPVQIAQGGALVCEIRMEVTLLEASLAERLEGRRARDVVSAILARCKDAARTAQSA